MFALATGLRSVVSRVAVGSTATTTTVTAKATAAVTAARAASTNAASAGAMKPEAGTETGIASGPAAAQIRGGANAAATPAAAAAVDPLSGKPQQAAAYRVLDEYSYQVEWICSKGLFFWLPLSPDKANQCIHST